MEIWIDDRAKNNKSTGIKFPVGGGNTPMRAGGANRQEPKELRQQLSLKLLTMELTGFKDGLNGPQSVSRKYIEWLINSRDSNRDG